MDEVESALVEHSKTSPSSPEPPSNYYNGGSVDEVKSAPVEPPPSLALSSSYPDSALNIPKKVAAISPSAPGFHRDYPHDNHEVFSVGSGPATYLTPRTPPLGSDGRATMVEKLDLPEPEGVGQVRADRERALVKYFGRRVPQAGLAKAMRPVASVVISIIVSKEMVNHLGSSAGGVPTARPQSGDSVFSSNSPPRTSISSSRADAANEPSQPGYSHTSSSLKLFKSRRRKPPSRAPRASASSSRAGAAAGPSQPGSSNAPFPVKTSKSRLRPSPSKPGAALIASF